MNYIEGFTHPFSLKPESTALLVIDLQNATGNRHLGLGRLLAERGESATYRFDRIEQVVIPHVQQLLLAFRKLTSATVIFITYGATLADCSDVPVHIRSLVQATNNIVGQVEHDIVDALQPLPAIEPVLNKATQGAFASTGINTLLKTKGITTVVCTGVSTNNCVGMTAMEASDQGYGVVIASDATGTCSEEMQNAFLCSFQRLWGRVMTTDEIVQVLNSAVGLNGVDR